MPKPRQQEPVETDGSGIDACDIDRRQVSPHWTFFRRRPRGAHRFTRLPLADSGGGKLLLRGAVAIGVLAVVSLGLFASGVRLPHTAATTVGEAAPLDRTTEDHGDRSSTREQEPEVLVAPEPQPAEKDLPPKPVAGLDQTQMDNAVTVVEIGRELGFSARGQAVALVTAMQESLLRNVASEAVPESLEYDHEGTMVDYDSVGLFQQRPSMGWGTVEQCMDVEYATTTFYNALDQISGWEDMALTEAAQAVQGSAYPDRYAQWEDMAWAVIEEVAA